MLCRMTVWIYPRVVVVNVHDGDTIAVDIDYGRDTWARNAAVRLFGIAARELRAPGGKEARDHLAALLPVGTVTRVDSYGWDKYGGRIDALVWLPDGSSVQSRMISDGYAAAWDGRGVQPQPPWPIPLTTITP